MGKKILFLLTFAFFSGAHLYGQINGGGGIIHVTGDPDLILAAQAVDINEGNICFDRANQIVYFYDPSGAVGDRWNPVAVSSFTDTDTRLNNPNVSGGNLVFDIVNALDMTVTGTVSVAILDIAPVQDIAGGGDVVVTDDGSGNFTVSFTEAITSLTIDNGTLKYTDENGVINDVVLPTADGSETDVQGDNGITVSGTGTSADPYIVELEGSSSANAGEVPFSNGDGSISWKDVIQSVTVDAQGRFMATLTDGSTTLISLDNAPRIQTIGELETQALALNAGETGIAVAGTGNILGLPSQLANGVEVGVLFFIKEQ